MNSKYSSILTKEVLIEEYVKNRIFLNQIAKQYNCCMATVIYNLRKCNISLRPRSESVKMSYQKTNRKLKIINKNNPNFKHGKYCKDEKYYCINCNQEISKQTKTGRCRSCWDKYIKRDYFKQCINCGKQIGYKSKRCYSCSGKNREHKRKISLSRGGTGIPYEFNKYPDKFFKVRPKIRKRDNYTCQKCFKIFNKFSSELDVHHIDYNKENCDENNLISLCEKCNNQVNFNRDYWKEYFKRGIKNGSFISEVLSV